MKKVILALAMTMMMASAALAADNLPLDNQKGFYVGVETSTNYMHVEPTSNPGLNFKVDNPITVVTGGYGTELYSVGIYGGAGSFSIKNAFGDIGDAKDTVSVFGINAKVTPLKYGQFKLGLVADVKRVGAGSDTMAIGGGLTEKMDFGPVWSWSTAAIAQYQPSKYVAVFAGEKFEDLASADITIKGVFEGADVYEGNTKLRQLDKFSTVAGVVITPIDNVNIVLQGKYTDSVPMSLLAAVEYRF